MLTLFLMLTVLPPPLYNDPALEGEQVRVLGSVNALRFRNDRFQIFLRDVLISQDIGSVSKQKKRQYRLKGVVCYTDGKNAPHIGSRVVITGVYHNLRRPTNPGEFDNAGYMRSRGVEGSVVSAVTAWESESCDPFAQGLYQLRSRLISGMGTYLDEADTGILSAMLFGDKDSITQEDKGLFERSGCAHLLVVSGTHVAIIGLGVYRLLKRLTGKITISAVISGVLLYSYSVMTGMGPSTKRAVIMFALCLLSESTGRAYDLITALSLSGAVMLMTDPFLIYDGGFLLSCTAVLGIAAALPVLGRDEWFPGRDCGMGRRLLMDKLVRPVGNSLVVSAYINIFTIPIQLLLFCRFPVYSVLTNLVLIPIMPALLGGGAVLALLASAGAGSVLLYLAVMLCTILLKLYRLICSFSLSLPGGIHITGQPEGWEIAAYYGVLITAGLLYERRRTLGEDGRSRVLFRGTIAAVIVMTLVFTATVRRKGGMNLIMLDVGQGQGLIAYTRDNCIMVDCGSNDEKKVGTYRVIPALKALGINRVDMIYITHGDADHVNALSELFDNAEAEGIDLGGVATTANCLYSEAGERIIREASQDAIKVYRTGAGDEVSFGDMLVRILYPGDERGDANELSLGIELEYNKMDQGCFTALITGDMGTEGEETLCDRLKAGSRTLYVAGHHGSRGSSGDELMERIRPRVTFVSCGRDSIYGHPHREALERIGSVCNKVYITSQKGAVALNMKNGRYRVKWYGRNE